MSKKFVRKQKTVHFKNKTYVGMLRNSVLTVKTKQTAQGQMVIVGCYDTLTNKWHDTSRKTFVPKAVREELEKAFGFAH